MESVSKSILIADIGGTNCRFDIYQLQDHQFLRKERIIYETQQTKSLSEVTLQFLKDVNIDVQLIEAAVLAIAGPVEEGGIIPVMSNIKHWGSISEAQFSQSTGLLKVKFLNDFVANGYGILNVDEKLIQCLYKPSDCKEDHEKVKGVIGIGTGLGSCFLARESKEDLYQVYPSETSMIQMPLYNKFERLFEQYLREQKNEPRRDIQLILSGDGLKRIFEVLVTQSSEPKTSKLLEEKKLDDIKASDITRYAKEEKDEICLEVLKIFIEYLGKFLTDFSLIFLPFGGIYLTSTIILELTFLLEQEEIKSMFLERFQNRGSLTDQLKTIPIYIVKDQQLGENGCLYYAKTYLIQ